jgi:hypothetical protein
LNENLDQKKQYHVVLGRAGWRLLHTMAAHYPEDPTDEMKKDMASFLELFRKLFPCHQCRGHLQEIFRKHPPRLDSQKEFSLWMCEVHNMVNDHLGKKHFPCANVDADYDCGCAKRSLLASTASSHALP